ncbi:MAG: glutamine--fructose-6-phosphate transaminase (isomerizing) [Planctomycetes bacterium]|nr:glutamine--fructose-6-phosphate transaminase (isomerizing) [Planctomycetota bacterium]
MCGIVGYVGKSDATDYLLQGLYRLEYRGYDSAGLSMLRDDGVLERRRSVGRIANLDVLVRESPVASRIGIGHTRWATHGAATVANAHPHFGGQSDLSLVHNGVIENYAELKHQLMESGYFFQSETDTEVIAHLLHQSIAEQRARGLFDDDSPVCYATALREVVGRLRGTYGLVVMFQGKPDFLLAARCGSPLVIGVGQGEQFIASDPAPLHGKTDKVITLVDHQIAIVTSRSIQVIQRDSVTVQPNIQVLAQGEDSHSCDGHDHFMHKEIYQQPEAIRNALRGRLDRDSATAKLGGLNLTAPQLRHIERLILTGCGTSWHSALIGEYMIEEIARMPVEVEYASELRYRNPPVDKQTLVFGITQSGETADTLAALREMRRKGHPTLAICNNIGSSIAREADGGIYLHAGPEIGVASTKAFTSQVVVLGLLALYFGRMRHLSFEAGLRWIDALEGLADQVELALQTEEQIKQIALEFKDSTNVLYLGRNYLFPTALEGALKLKEISYIHAEGYPAAEMKHGPIALVDEHTPSVFLLSKGLVYDKIMSNLQEVKARGGPVIAITDSVDAQLEKLADRVILVPSVPEPLQPIISVVPLQLLAYHIALLRNCDVDKPRNLAKSVTVE